MSEPSASEVLEMLAKYVEAYWQRDGEEAAFREVPVGSSDLMRAVAAENAAQDALIALKPEALRALAALTPPAPAEADQLRAEVARLRGVLAETADELDVDDAASLRWMASDALGPQPIFKSEDTP